MMVDRPYLNCVNTIAGVHHVLPDLNDFSSRSKANHSAVCVTVADIGVSITSSEE
jgi:hypothetical protein